jgi:limonene 1,2-monooxygenase
MTSPAYRFGVFLAPYHSVHENPTLAYERDLELVEWVDRLGFDEAWFGEHHSAGTEIIGAPDLFIVAAAEHTNRLKLGTGVTSLPYYHPFLLAERMIQLDHMTRGRAILGCGPGALPGDAYMMGIETTEQRRMMREALEAILALWRSEEPIDRESDWFTLRHATLQLRPYTRPHPEVAVAATFSPSGPQLAGTFGTGLLSIAATQKQAFDALARHWRVAQETAEKHGHTVERADWRMVGPMHIAETMEQARRDTEEGLTAWVEYFRKVGAIPILGDFTDEGDLIGAVNESGVGVIGTPDMAVEQLQRLERQSGGFGTFLIMAHEWANREATLRSYELFSRYVIPVMQGTTRSLVRSRDWTIENREQFIGNATDAIRKATEEYKQSRRPSDDGDGGSDRAKARAGTEG